MHHEETCTALDLSSEIMDHIVCIKWDFVVYKTKLFINKLPFSEILPSMIKKMYHNSSVHSFLK